MYIQPTNANINVLITHTYHPSHINDINANNNDDKMDTQNTSQKTSQKTIYIKKYKLKYDEKIKISKLNIILFEYFIFTLCIKHTRSFRLQW